MDCDSFVDGTTSNIAGQGQTSTRQGGDEASTSGHRVSVSTRRNPRVPRGPYCSREVRRGEVHSTGGPSSSRSCFNQVRRGERRHRDRAAGSQSRDTSCRRRRDDAIVKQTMERLRHNQFLVRICPNHELSTSNVLKWILTEVESVPAAEDDTLGGGDQLRLTAGHGESSAASSSQKALELGLTLPASHGEASGASPSGKALEIAAGAHTTKDTAYPETDTHAALLTQTAANVAGSDQFGDSSTEETSDDRLIAGESQVPETKEEVVTTSNETFDD